MTARTDAQNEWQLALLPFVLVPALVSASLFSLFLFLCVCLGFSHWFCLSGVFASGFASLSEAFLPSLSVSLSDSRFSVSFAFSFTFSLSLSFPCINTGKGRRRPSDRHDRRIRGRRKSVRAVAVVVVVVVAVVCSVACACVCGSHVSDERDHPRSETSAPSRDVGISRESALARECEWVCACVCSLCVNHLVEY